MATLKVIFKLKEPNSKKPTLIYMLFNYGYYEYDKNGSKKYMPLKFSTGEEIDPKFWNANPVYRAKETRKVQEHPEFNTNLDNLESGVKTVYRTLVNDKIEVTPGLLRKELNIYLEKTKRTKRTNLISFIEKFIEESKINRKPTTIKKYKNVLNHLVAFSESKKKRIDFDTVTLDFYYDFLDYLYSDLNFSKNTAGKLISTLKTFLNEATERGLNAKYDFKSRKFKPPYEEVDKIYLTDEELIKIYKLDLSDNKRLEKVRDLFLLESYLGLRYSDMIDLKPEHIQEVNGRKMVRKRTIKTGETVVIPLHWIATEIFEKYDYQIPRSNSNQKTNQYLKEIGKLAEIDNYVEIIRTSGTLRVNERKRKYELITTHVARRSFATNLYLAGIPSISIMKITGHKTEKVFLGYIKISQEENAQKLMEHPYFQAKSSLRII